MKPLAGRRVLVTRARAQAAELVHLLEDAGADVVIAPSIRVAPPGDPAPLHAAAADPSQFDWILFASANGVDAYLDAVAAAAASIPAGTRVGAVGSKTAERIRERGLEVALLPSEFRAEALADAMAAGASLTGVRVLLPRADIGRDVLAARLRDAGARVTDVVAYRTVPDTTPAALVPVDVVTFTSGSSVRNFVERHGTAPLADAVVAVIGPVTGDVARSLGIRVDVQPDTYTSAAMVEALAQFFNR